MPWIIGGALLGGTLLSGKMGADSTADAAESAKFNPYNVKSSFGGVDYDPSQRLFTSSLDPALTGINQRFINQLGQISPEQQLGLFRQQASPYNQAASQGLENRLFSQGRLDHSQVYEPGGAMRGLFDSFANQDLMFQQQAAQQALAQQQGLLGNIGGIQAMEMGLFNPAQQMGGLGMQGQSMSAALQAQGGQIMPNMMSSLLGGATMGWAQSGFQSPFSGGGGGFTGANVHAGVY